MAQSGTKLCHHPDSGGTRTLEWHLVPLWVSATEGVRDATEVFLRKSGTSVALEIR